MKLLMASFAILVATQASAAGRVSVQTFSDNTMVEIFGAAAEKLYKDLNVPEDTTGSDEEGAPKATKLGESIFCSKRTAAQYYCVMYMDPKTGTITGY